MNRIAIAALLTFALAAGVARAQDGQVRFVTSGLVAFTVTPDAIAEAAACPACTTIEPDPGPDIVLEVRRQNPHRHYTIDVLHDGWGAASGGEIEVRHTVTSVDGRVTFHETPWLRLGATPTEAFGQAVAQDQNRVRVAVAYRLRLTGTEAAGTYLTRVTHRVRENGSAVAHDLRVALPSFLTLRRGGGASGGAGATVIFDYGGDPTAYLQAVATGARLPPTGGDLDRLEVSTNHPSGYTVTLRVVDVLAPDPAAGLRDRLTLGDGSAHDRRFVGGGPTGGFVTLLTTADFGLRVDGGEAPGLYLFRVEYHGARNP